VLNKFRGDPALLGDGTAWLEARTGVPTVGVLPYLPVALPEEDAHTLGVGTHGMLGGHEGLDVALVRLPTVANFDEFDALAAEPAVTLRWVRTPEALAGADLIVLPGSKHVVADGAWLRRTGLAARIKGLAARGVAVLGVCGGLQLLGRHIHDPHGVEGAGGAGGLGIGLELLELDTTLAAEKITRRTRAELLPTGETVTGYEIHHGRSHAWGETQPYLAADLGFRRGNITGVYLHGLFEDTAFRRSFLAELGVEAATTTWSAQLEGALDALADHVEAHLDPAALDRALAPPSAKAPPPARLILVTGGARSGKSRYAEALVRHLLHEGETALYLATLNAGDDEMIRRVARHRARRDARWRTLEAPRDPAAALRGSGERVVLLDCLSGWVANVALEHEDAGEEAVLEAVRAGVEGWLEVLREGRKTVVVVTNEVGSGVVPAYALGRWYRDALGAANARVAAAADAVSLCVVGLPQLLKGSLPEVPLDTD
jgi:adenosylcobyric acid synthase